MKSSTVITRHCLVAYPLVIPIKLYMTDKQKLETNSFLLDRFRNKGAPLSQRVYQELATIIGVSEAISRLPWIHYCSVLVPLRFFIMIPKNGSGSGIMELLSVCIAALCWTVSSSLYQHCCAMSEPRQDGNVPERSCMCEFCKHSRQCTCAHT